MFSHFRQHSKDDGAILTRGLRIGSWTGLSIRTGNENAEKDRVSNMSAKETLLEVADKLPVNATLDDAIYELEFRQAVEQGLAELDLGEGMPIEEVRAKIAEWAGK
jgi:predicted transcriptional regulator